MVAPLRFVFGNEGQVLLGIEKALGVMRKGDYARVIIPSWNAFGNTGSADGRVLPYTPVIYEVEVLEVAQK
jgi:FKBP-type peptidyl-prolyl cis-trans isomerase